MKDWSDALQETTLSGSASPTSWDVEVVAFIAPDGSVRSKTRSIPLPLPSLVLDEETRDSAHVDTWPDTKPGSPAACIHHKMCRLPSLVDEVTPALLRLKGEEDSLDSDSACSVKSKTAGTKFEGAAAAPPSPAVPAASNEVIDATEASNESLGRIVGASSTRNLNLPTSTHALIHGEDGTVGPYDCLSDNFTNLFCSVVLCAQPTTFASSNTSTATAASAGTNAALASNSATHTSHNYNVTTVVACADEGCNAYPLPDYYDESDFGFASMPLLWLRAMNNTTGNGNEFSVPIPTRPNNRSCGVGGPKQRSKHLEGIWKTWHATTEQDEAIPILERSKSLPEKLRTTTSIATSTYPYNYNLDPEQADLGYDSDPEQDYPRRRAQRAKALINQKSPNQTPSYRDQRPPSIDTTMSMMTPRAKIFSDDSTPYYLQHPPPPPPPPTSSRHRAAPAFDFDHDEYDDVVAQQPHPGNSIKTRAAPLPTNPPPRRQLRAGLDPFNPQGPSSKDLMTPQGEMFLRTFIHEATNTKIPLIWHRCLSNTDGTPSRTSNFGAAPINRPPPPMAVTCTFEVGAHLDQVVVQPKFTWSPTHEPHLDQRKIRLSGGEPHSIELLSIIRVIQPQRLNRQLYPFARLDRTLCITTNDESFEYLVLEAESTRARDWLVNALKMIVARLASIIIVRDEAMLLEFFTPFAGLMHLEEEQALEQHRRDHDDHHRRHTYDHDYDDVYTHHDDYEVEERDVEVVRAPRSTFSSTGEAQLVSPTIKPAFCDGKLKLVSYATGK